MVIKLVSMLKGLIMTKKNILDYSYGELESEIVSMDEKKFRTKQIYGFLMKGINNFGEIFNLPKILVEKLENDYYIGMPKIRDVQISQKDGTRKYLFEFPDKSLIESVLMRYKYGNSICISSQVGCRMGCKFCASTLNGLKRNLTKGEMLAQILAASKDSGEKINHIVVMGIGEPFDNYENLYGFLNMVNSEEGLNIGMRNITVSTCGIVPMINRFGKDFPQVNLAISLHSPYDKSRSDIMPINRKYGIEELISACSDYTKLTKRRITFEYTLVRGKNDSKTDAISLSKLLKGMLCHVNLIPLNEVNETGLKKSNNKNVEAFRKILTENGINATVRRELGADIDAACGQLRNKIVT